MRRKIPLTAALVLLSLLAAAPSALGADTLTSEDVGVTVFKLKAAAGHSNHVTVSASENALTIKDSGDTIETLVAGCSLSGGHEVHCYGSGFGEVVLNLNDEADSVDASGSIEIYASGDNGDDTLSASGGVPFTAYGGAGSDTLNGGSGTDTLAGAEGADTVHGNGGADIISLEGPGDRAYGDAGNDTFVSAASVSGGDFGDGGPGLDELLYLGLSGGPPSYAVDLNAGAISWGSGGDSLVNFEDAVTYQGPDTVTGTQGANRIITSLQEEPLVGVLSSGGLAGLAPDAGDTVDPLGGPDFVKTGAGNDIVNLVDGSADRLDCGPGNDIVQADQLDQLTDCENVTVHAVTPVGAQMVQPDTAKPKCSLRGIGKHYDRKAFMRRLKAGVVCGEPVTIEARLTTALRNSNGKHKGKRGKRRGSRRASASKAGEVVLVERSEGIAPAHSVKLRTPGKLGRLVGNRFKATLEIVARDAAGNATTLRRTIRVRPSRKHKKRHRSKKRRRSSR